MTKEQICTKCGQVFLRSLYHPQITVCPSCKEGKDRKHCIYCARSHKKEGDLYCDKHHKIVTSCLSCDDFIPDFFTEAQKKEIASTLEMIGGKRWI